MLNHGQSPKVIAVVKAEETSFGTILKAPPLTRHPSHRCRWDSNELQFRLGEVLQHPGPAGRSQSFLCDSQLGTHPLWPRIARTEWPYLQEEATSSANLEGCVCWNHSVGHNSSPGWGLKGQDRSHPGVGIWGDSGLPLAHVILREPLSSLDSGTQEPELPPLCAMQDTLHSFEETGPGLYTEDMAQVSGPPFRF